jgi:PAS domain S-box-containing protein
MELLIGGGSRLLRARAARYLTPRTWAASLARTLVLVVLYVAAAKAAFAIAFVHTSIAPVWPPSGIALAAVLLFGYRAVPGVLLGAFLFNATTPVPLWVCAAIAIGNTLEAVLAAWLLRRAGFRPAIDRVRDVLALVGLAALVSTAVSASVGVASLWLSGIVPDDEVRSAWAVWWLGDASGMLTVAPLLLLASAWRQPRRPERGRVIEAVALAATLASVVEVGLTARVARPFLVFPALVWAAVRFRQAGAALASLFVSVVVVWLTLHGHGPFVESSVTQSLLLTQASAGALMATSLVLAALTVERELAAQTLGERERQLAQAQTIAQLGSFELEIATDQLTWSPGLQRIYGRDADDGATFEAFIAQVHPEDRARVAETIRRSTMDGTPFRIEQQIVRPNGEVRVLASRGEVACDEHGRPLRLIGVCQDVTDQRHSEEQLAEAYAQAELSRRLQNGLLPVLSLHDQALLLRTRYQAGQERALLGADFYDALELPDGTVATLIGDVAGHGPDEAAVGVALRAAWRGLVLSGHGPGPVLDGLDKVLVWNRPSEEMFTTVCCTWISPDRTRVTLALAGHPPPLLVSAGQVRVEEVPGGPALGIHDDGYAWEAKTLEVGDAWTLLCYTDGLVEGLQAPGSVDRFGIDALVETVARLLAADDDLDAMLDGVLAVVRGANGGELSDDVAILCCSQLPLPDPATDGQRAPVAVARVELGPDPSSPAHARRFVHGFSARHALPVPVNDRLVLVSCELVTNAVLHAGTPLTLSLELHRDLVRVSVRDEAAELPALRNHLPDALTGRGLRLVAETSRVWGVDPAGGGKTVWADIGLPAGGRPAD